jgi:hypothetical protein
MKKVRNSEALADIFGYWPSFHDAEVVEVRVNRGDSLDAQGEVRKPTLEADIHVFETTDEVTEEGFYALRKHTLATLAFRGIDELKLDGFNHQSVLFGLGLHDISDRQLEVLKWRVSFDSSFGLAATFMCEEIVMVRAVPFRSTRTHGRYAATSFPSALAAHWSCLSWIEAVCRLGHSSVQEMRGALERDERVGVASDGLDELDISSCRDEARDAGVAEVVEAITLAVDAGEPQRRIPDALTEVRRLEWRAAHRAEDELVGRVAAALDGPGSQLAERTLNGGEERHRADAGISLRPPELLTRISALHADQPTLAVDVSPAERTKLAEPEPCPEGNVEEADEEEIGLTAKRIERRELDQRLADRLRVLRRDLLAGEVLCRREVGSRGWVCEDEALPDGVGQHLAERDDHVSDRAGCPAVRLELGDEAVHVLSAERRESAVAQAREDVPLQVQAVALIRRRREARSTASADTSGIAVRQPPLSV